jgi:hypothetical protein
VKRWKAAKRPQTSLITRRREGVTPKRSCSILRRKQARRRNAGDAQEGAQAEAGAQKWTMRCEQREIWAAVMAAAE